ncbi:SDR family NAD(P)-dependent oxidoreductase [Kribbella sp. CWNU-51]
MTAQDTQQPQFVGASAHDVNVLITMAGIMQVEDLRDPGHLATAEQTIEINLLGTIRTVTAFTPYLLKQRDPAILAVSSGLASVPLTITPAYSATKAAIHSYTQSLRIQLADAGVQVIEVVPPAVRTALLNQEDDERAMPLEEYLTETMDLLRQHPDADEILVDRVRFLRDAERENRYDQVIGILNSVG